MASGSDTRRAFRAERPKDLLRGQETALSGILRKILKIIEANQDRDRKDDIRRPHQVFCLDGARGSGKTFSLLSLEYALRTVSGLAPSERSDGGEPSGAGDPTWDKALGEEMVSGLRLNQARQGRPQLVHPLRIIFPGDMEHQEVLMEAIFAAIRRDIDDTLGITKDEKARREGEALRDTLTEHVAQGWYFARRFGVEAVIKDSMDFKGLVRKFDQLNRLASDRISAWREFVDTYLKWRGVSCLAVLLDDSDVSPELTFNILHSIRTFLNHPRIVTILAGNLRAMRDSLVHLSMQRLARPIQSLNEPRHVTGTDWRRAERVAIEHYLEKILPEPNRFFLGKPRTQQDYESITHYTLADICERRARLHREEFHKAKFQMAILIELDRSDMPNERQTHQMEDYLSWWLYQTRYLPALAPRSARQAQSFGEFYAVSDETLEARAKGEADTSLGHKRLPVMLFGNPANHSLVQRFSDEDPNVSTWLMRQNLRSHWVGVRHFEINGRRVAEGSYTYDYIRYRIDLGLTLPIRNNGEAMPPLKLLPVIRGRRRMRHFFHPPTMTRQARKVGVARWMDHAAVPGNCLCFYDIVGMPDLAFVDIHGDDTLAGVTRRRKVESGGEWEAQLWAHWPELLDDNPDAPGIAQYFIVIVCERLRVKEGEIRTAALLSLLGAERPERSLVFSYHEFLRDELGVLCGATSGREEQIYEEAKDRLIKMNPSLLALAALQAQETGTQNDPNSRKAATPKATASPDASAPPGIGPPGKGPKRARTELDQSRALAWVARYSALATDLRRAWHAICIHSNTLRANAASDNPLAFSSDGQTMMGMMRNSERMRLYRLKDIEAVINLDDWMKLAFVLFDEARIRDALAAETGKPDFDIDLMFKFDEVGDPKDFENADRFERWVRAWRKVGRILCDGWPIHGEGASEREPYEKVFFKYHDQWKLDLEPVDDERAKTTRNKESAEPKSKMRSARDFVWLMFGLAPSLPAVIHAEIAGQIFDGPMMPGSLLDNSPQAVWQRLKKSEAILQEWCVFVAKATGILRYIKTKCLQLHADVAIFEGYVPNNDERRKLAENGDVQAKADCELSDSLVKHLESNVNAYLRSEKVINAKRYGNFHADEFFRAMSPKLRRQTDSASKDGFNTELWIMPDFAPATLFGPHWLMGLAKRYAAPDLIEMPGEGEAGDSSTEGAFGEIEHWLWGAHAMLSQAKAAIVEAQEDFGAPPV